LKEIISLYFRNTVAILVMSRLRLSVIMQRVQTREERHSKRKIHQVKRMNLLITQLLLRFPFLLSRKLVLVIQPLNLS